MADASQQINGLGYLTPSSAAKAVSSADAAVSTNPPASNDGSTIGVQVEFGGGLDLLFSRQPRHNLRIPASYPSSSSTISPNSPSSPPTMRHLIEYLAKNVLREREELFREGETVRPGILVLVNDIDWELEGELACVLEDGDEVVFISTLHGG